MMIHLSHISVFKIAIGMIVADVVALAISPTVESALIMSIPSLGTLVLGFLIRRDNLRMLVNQAKMKESMDGHFTKLLSERQEMGEQLTDKTDKLAHAEGRREGVEATEDKARPPGTPS
jgi:hypothetical protein